MISYRHHIVSLVAVFLALAVGIVLGGGPLTELGRAATPTDDTRRASRTVERSAEFGDEFAAESAAGLYDDRLAGQAVAVLTLPGAPADEVGALVEQIGAAGGSVAGTYRAQRGLVAASEKSLVDTLGSQLMTQLGSSAVSADAPTYERMGQLLGLALAPTGADPEETTSVRQSLAGAELLSSPRAPEPSGLVLVVLGDAVDSTILSGLVGGLASQATGLVVAGDTASGSSGDLRALRAEDVGDTVATVDGSDTTLGQVTTALALARSVTEPGGSFGASGADGPVPLG